MVEEAVVEEVDVVDGSGRVVATVVNDAVGARDAGAVMERPSTCTGLAVETTELAPGVTLASPIAEAIRPSATKMVARRWRVMGEDATGAPSEVYELDTGKGQFGNHGARSGPIPNAMPDLRGWSEYLGPSLVPRAGSLRGSDTGLMDTA